MAKIRKVTAATRAAILRKSDYALPNNPSDAGFGADDIRGALFRPLTDERDSALAELDRVAAETGDSLALTASETDTVFGQSGTYLHGVFDAPEAALRTSQALAQKKGVTLTGEALDTHAYKEQQYDKLADSVRKSLDMEWIYRIMEGKA